MKKYLANEARQSAIDHLTKLIEVVATTRGDVIDYLDARAIIEVLADRREDLEKEIKERNSRKE